MKIESLKLQNCRRHSLTNLSFSRGNIFIGGGRQGKSTIAQGIRLGISGRNCWTKFSQNKWHDDELWVTDGELNAQVSVTADGQVYSAVVSTEGKLAPQTGFDHKIAGVCLTTRGEGSFSQMPVPSGSTRKREQSNLLFGLLGEVITPDVILRYLGLWGKKDKVRLPDLAEWLSSRPEFNRWPNNPYKTAYDARARVRALRDDREAQLKVAPPPEPHTVTKEQVDWLQHKLRTMASEVAALEERGRQSNGGRQALYEERHRSWEALSRQHREAAAAVQRAQAGVTSNATQRSAEEIIADLGATKSRLEAAKAERQSASDDLANVGKTPCPAGSCARIAAANARQTLAEKDAAVNLLDRQRDDLVVEQQLRERTDRAQVALDAAQAARASLAALDQEPQPPSMVVDPTFEAELVVARKNMAIAEDEVAMAEAAHQTFRDWLSASETYEAIGEQFVTYQTEYRYWDAATKALAPDGIQAIILGKAAADLNRQLNELASYFVDSDGKVLKVELGTHGGVHVCNQPWDGLCGSDEGIASSVVQVLTARLSGFGVVAIDEMGMDRRQRQQLMKMLMDQKDIQWFLFCLADKVDTAGKLLPPAPINHPEVSTFHVDQGEVHVISCPQMGRMAA